MQIAIGDIVGNGRFIAIERLKDNGELLIQIIKGHLANVRSINANAALVGIIEAGNQLDEGCFARAILAHNGDGLTGQDVRDKLARKRMPRYPDRQS